MIANHYYKKTALELRYDTQLSLQELKRDVDKINDLLNQCGNELFFIYKRAFTEITEALTPMYEFPERIAGSILLDNMYPPTTISHHKRFMECENLFMDMIHSAFYIAMNQNIEHLPFVDYFNKNDMPDCSVFDKKLYVFFCSYYKNYGKIKSLADKVIQETKRKYTNLYNQLV